MWAWVCGEGLAVTDSGEREWDRGGIWPLLSAAAALVALWLGTGCSNDILDVDVDLAPQSYSVDFGQQSGTIPTVTCDPAVPAACGSGVARATTDAAGIPGDVSVAMGCDAATARCFAQADARVAYTADVLQEQDFQTKVQRRAVSLVRVADVAYSIPTNTLTFDVPAIDVYVGPAGARTESDPGVVLMDTIHPVPAGTTFTEPRHLTLADDSPARALVEGAVRDQQPFVFVVVVSPRVEAGGPMPGGALQVDVFPKLLLGF